MHPKVISFAAAIGLIGAISAQVPSASAADLALDRTSATASDARAESADYSKAMQRLLEAAQRLRDATHAMAQQKPGAERNQAIRQTNEALLDTQRAMMALPFELQYRSESAPDYEKAMGRLKQAAQKLRDATHAMAAQPPGEGRNAAIKQTNEALLETQQAMVDLIPDTHRSTTGLGAKRSN